MFDDEGQQRVIFLLQRILKIAAANRYALAGAIAHEFTVLRVSKCVGVPGKSCGWLRLLLRFIVIKRASNRHNVALYGYIGLNTRIQQIMPR